MNTSMTNTADDNLFRLRPGVPACSRAGWKAARSKTERRARQRAIGFPRRNHEPGRARPLTDEDVDEVDRPTRIVAISGERLPRCCEYGAFPARSARPPSLLGGRDQGDTASDRRVLGHGGCVGHGSPGSQGAARIADASPAAYATTTRAGPGGQQCRLVRCRRSTGARRDAAAPTAGLAGSAGVRGLPLPPAPPAATRWTGARGCPPPSPLLQPLPGLSRGRARSACRARR